MASTTPLSRPLVVDTIPATGSDITIETKPEERAALARDFGVPSVDSLSATFHVTRRGSTVAVTGTVRAAVTRTCVVTLDDFTETVEEPVDLRFTDDPTRLTAPDESGEHEADVDAPDPIVNGRIDLGSVTAEFLALGLDPYPRKPGVDFAWEEGEADPSPFAKLAALKKPPEG